LHPGESRAQIGGDALDHGLSPALRLLAMQDRFTDVPVERHQFPVHRACSGEPRRRHAMLERLDELGIAGRQGFR